MTLAGRLDGSVDGRPFSLVADGRDITLSVDRVRTLFRMRPAWRSGGRTALTLLRRGEFRLLVRVRGSAPREVFPGGGFLVRLFLPRD